MACLIPTWVPLQDLTLVPISIPGLDITSSVCFSSFHTVAPQRTAVHPSGMDTLAGVFSAVDENLFHDERQIKIHQSPTFK